MTDDVPLTAPGTPPPRRAPRRKLTAFIILGTVIGMVGVSYAAVPLYRIFCEATGYGGTTQRSDTGSDVVLDRTVRVQFDSNTAPDLPWVFQPEQRSVTVHLGQTQQISYTATNTSDHEITGTAIFNVAPDEAGLYFVKIQCFCFTEQTLEPGQTAELPVLFYVDPKMADDTILNTLDTITLSYTFYPATATGAQAAAESPAAASTPGG